MRRRQQGLALIMVLWITVLMTVLAGSYALSARTENLQSSVLFGSTQARFMAEAGLNRAVYELRNPDPETRWIGDGRVYRMAMDGAEIEIRITDDTGKIDLNLASDELLAGLFMSLGMEFEEAMEYVDKVVDWRDPDNLPRLNGAEDDDYAAEGYPYGAKDNSFDTVPELQQVMGINYEMFRRLEPAITVYSGRRDINIGFAPPEALMALVGVTPELAQDFIGQRHQVSDLNEPLPELIAGQTGQLRGGGTTFSIVSKATLANGQWAELDATVRMGGTLNGRPFRVLRWRDNEYK